MKAYLQVIIISICLFISSSSLKAQNIDSLLEIRNNTTNYIDKYKLDYQIAQTYYDANDYENASIFIQKALQLANSFEHTNFKYEANILAGDIILNQKQYQKADSLYDIALSYASDNQQKIILYQNKIGTQYRLGDLDKQKNYLIEIRKYIGNDTTGQNMADYYYAYSNYFVEQRDFLNQLKYLLKSKEIKEKIDDDLNFINHNIASVYYGMGAYENFIKIQLELLKQNQINENTVNELFALFSIADGYYAIQDYKSCKKYCYKSIELKEKKNVSNVFGFVYYLLGSSHMKENQLDSAEYYFNKGIKISLERGEKKELGDNYIGMSQLKLLQGNHQEAKNYAEKVRETINYIDFNTNSTLAKLYQEEGQYKKAYDLLRVNWNEWEKQEENRTTYKIISSLISEKYEREKQEEQSAFEEAIDRQRRLMFRSIFIICLLLALIVVIIQARNNRKLRQLNASLQQRNEALKQFTYITSHDLKEPIRNINSFAGLLERRFYQKSDNKIDLEYLGFIKNSASTMQTIIQSLRLYVDTSLKAVKREEVNIEKTINSLRQNLNTLISERNAVLIIENPEQIQNIQFSSPMLVLILQNLVQNGIKYNNSTYPTVTISLSKQQSNVLFKVTDNGIGIKKDFFEKVFQPFKTLKNKSVINASGLGLTICKNIIENYNGKIWVESDGQVGSQFYFYV